MRWSTLMILMVLPCRAFCRAFCRAHSGSQAMGHDMCTKCAAHEIRIYVDKSKNPSKRHYAQTIVVEQTIQLHGNTHCYYAHCTHTHTHTGARKHTRARTHTILTDGRVDGETDGRAGGRCERVNLNLRCQRVI